MYKLFKMISGITLFVKNFESLEEAKEYAEINLKDYKWLIIPPNN